MLRAVPAWFHFILSTTCEVIQTVILPIVYTLEQAGREKLTGVIYPKSQKKWQSWNLSTGTSEPISSALLLLTTWFPGIIWELVRNVESQATSQNYEIRIHILTRLPGDSMYMENREPHSEQGATHSLLSLTLGPVLTPVGGFPAYSPCPPPGSPRYLLWQSWRNAAKGLLHSRAFGFLPQLPCGPLGQSQSFPLISRSSVPASCPGARLCGRGRFSFLEEIS